MRIAIDIRKLHDYGIGTYIRNLIRELARKDKKNEYVLLCRKNDLKRVAALGANFTGHVQSASNYSLTEQIAIPSSLWRSGATLFHTPHYVLPLLTPCRSIVTIHDCIHLKFPQYLPNRIAHTYAWANLWTATHKARRVLTVSEFSKKDIVRYFNIPEEKVTVIPNAIDERFKIAPSEIEMARLRDRYQLPNRFVMYAGNIKPHKNIERLIDAFALVHKRGLDDIGLLVTGSEVSQYSKLRRAVHQYGLRKHVRFLGFQTEANLAVLYRLASVFVIPSLYEGFGLSPLEALASDTPVVASNASSLPEVLGDAAILVDPYEVRAIADGIVTALEDSDVIRDLKRKGRVRVEHFSWEHSINRVKRIYQEVGAEH